MSLINQHSDANRVIDAALSVCYYKRIVQGTWEGKSLVGDVTTATYSLMHEYHRVARKTYKYVGMTKTAADACAAAMRTLYTRTVKFQKWNPIASENSAQGTWETTNETSTEMSAEIVPRNVAGEMWEVTVNVNEDSVYMSRTDIARNMATIFATEKQRSYDGETE